MTTVAKIATPEPLSGFDRAYAIARVRDVLFGLTPSESMTDAQARDAADSAAAECIDVFLVLVNVGVRT